jgi:hypothetical protein
MNMLRVGKVIVNLDHVVDITSQPHSLIVNFVNGQTHTFTGDDAEGLKAYIERTVKSATVPLKDFEVK